VAVNGSPRAAAGTTHRIVIPFLEGAAEAGARTEYVLLAEKDIHYCTGELHCLFKTPGRCIWNDAMTTLLPLVGTADVLVLATPVYFEGPTGQMKVFLDRLAPLLNPAGHLVAGGSGLRLHDAYRIGTGTGPFN
jgi:multimeric flavodoxin WrbA